MITTNAFWHSSHFTLALLFKNAEHVAASARNRHSDAHQSFHSWVLWCLMCVSCGVSKCQCFGRIVLKALIIFSLFETKGLPNQNSYYYSDWNGSKTFLLNRKTFYKACMLVRGVICSHTLAHNRHIYRVRCFGFKAFFTLYCAIVSCLCYRGNLGQTEQNVETNPIHIFAPQAVGLSIHRSFHLQTLHLVWVFMVLRGSFQMISRNP